MSTQEYIYPEAEKHMNEAFKVFGKKINIKKVRDNKENIIDSTMKAIESVLGSIGETKIVPISHLLAEEQKELAKSFLDSIIDNLASGTSAKLKESYKMKISKNPFEVGAEASEFKGILPKIANYILIHSVYTNYKPIITDTVENMIDGKKTAIDEYISRRKLEIAEEKTKQLEEEKKQLEEDYNKKIDAIKNDMNISDKEKETLFNQLNAEKDKKMEDFKIKASNVQKTVEAFAKKIDNIYGVVTGDERKILDDEARRYGYDPSFKENLRKTREKLKVDGYDDNQINYIITKASEDYAHMRKMMAANPDLFDRDMSQDTIQKENEQFQSKLRQQNLRYILPKFIERREKLVENTLNPELLKGAFAI